jgi:integrase/recombinase XerD
MKTLPADEKDYVDRFVDSLCLGNRTAATAYREVTRNLLCFVRARYGRVDLSEGALIAWLTLRHQHCAVKRVEELTKMANRFLDWMKTTGQISSNPFQELRSQYGKNLAPIVRALLSSNPRSALAKLRPLPWFGSVLGPLMRQHIALMRSLGYRYETGEGRLRRFDRFLQRRPDLADKPLRQLIDAWRQVLPGVQQVYYAQQCGRILSKAQARL